MAGLTLRNVKKSYGATQVMHGVDLDIEDGEFVVFVGPSGCGKSTLLRMIAGLEEISDGTVAIGEREVNAVAASKRGVAMVFQTYALYPHMTVYKNMAFGLKQIKTDPAEIDRRVKAAAEILQITDYLDRSPRNLSGGQRQRVAIGRAIVRDPEVFLFDEPLSNLDAALRVQTRLEIARLHERLKTTMIYVTVDAGTLLGREMQPNVQVGLRPEHLVPTDASDAVVEGVLELVENLGEYALVHLLTSSGVEFIAKTEKPPSVPKGSAIGFAILPELAHFFDKETGLHL
jgi:multiple sugar transport system ATP-binding protein/alpha-glucoside transport system ATP-binding protein